MDAPDVTSIEGDGSLDAGQPQQRLPFGRYAAARLRTSAVRRRARIAKRERPLHTLARRGFMGRVRRWWLRWRGRHSKLRLSFIGGLAGVVIFLAVVFLVAASLFGTPIDADSGCENAAPFACGTGLELFGTVVAVAFAFISFAGWRFFKVPAHYRDAAEKEASELVPTAVRIDEVVGRDGICEILMEDLCQRNPRPQIIVGGVGSGKTAVLVRLTKRLAELGAVPVPVHLREAQQELNFLSLAKANFLKRVEDKLHFNEEGERIWKKLCDDRRVVILADGLEEALLDVPDRRSAIAEAIKGAREGNHLLVVASRPDDALDRADAAFLRLEPLAVTDAVRYIVRPGSGNNADDAMVAKAAKVAAAAEVAEAPFFLRVARDLYLRGEMADVDVNGGPSIVRVGLLERWIECLRGDSPPRGADLSAADRRAAIQELESMARVALRDNSLELSFDRYEQSPHRDLHWQEDRDVRFVARTGERLELCELVGNGLRFRHSVMQAYLGARSLPESLYRWELGVLLRGLRISARSRSLPRRAMAQRYIERALKRPGREFLIALVMCCARQDDPMREKVRDSLLKEATRGAQDHPVESFDMLAAAYEIEALRQRQESKRMRSTAELIWQTPPSHNGGGQAPVDRLHANGSQGCDIRTIDAKLRAVCSMERGHGASAYDVLWRACMAESSYRVRLRAAQAIGSGGDVAFRALHRQIEAAQERRHVLARNGGFEQQDVRGGILCGWILPLLASTCRSNADEVCDILHDWVRVDQLHLGVQAHFAQGFKFEANRRPGRDHETPVRTRERLVGLARTLKNSETWWYSDISLVQALALWSLDKRLDRASLEIDVHNMASDNRHPFVQVAASLCLDAIDPSHGSPNEENPPSCYIWIDEAGLAARVGPDRLDPDTDLWLPVACGWLSLDGDARQLVAEVLLFLNLIEKGDDLGVFDREERRRNVLALRTELPHCLKRARDRERLVLRAEAHGGCPNGCGLKLCPYPDRELNPFRGELSETFCREQERLVRGRLKHIPVWQHSSLVSSRKRRVSQALEEFWNAMEERDKTPLAS